MRISATGSTRGFTLVELLIVLTIVGLLSAAVVLALPDPRGSLVAEAERFAARTAAARDRAILEAAAISVRVTAEGYGFERRRGGEWRPLDGKPFLGQSWSEGTRAMTDEARITFDPTGLATAARVVLSRGDDRVAVDIGVDGRVDVAA